MVRQVVVITCVVSVPVVVVIIVLLVRLLPQTGEFRARFMKKCEDFPKDRQTCETLLSTFEGTYVRKHPCCIPETNYDPVINLSPFAHSAHKTMLWSKTEGLVHEYARKSGCFVTLEDTLLGSVLDGESWCGKEGSNGTFMKLCKERKEDCNKSPVKSFWDRIAMKFAKHAAGVVTAMLNGDLCDAYDPKSVFARKEVPNLRLGVVTRLDVILVANKGNCSNPSLQNLKNDLNDRGIGYTCEVVTRSRITECINNNTPCGGCWGRHLHQMPNYTPFDI